MISLLLKAKLIPAFVLSQIGNYLIKAALSQDDFLSALNCWVAGKLPEWRCRSASDTAGDNGTDQMIVIDEATLPTNNMETIHSLDSQASSMLDTDQQEGDKENREVK